MYCSKCGKEVNETAVYCPRCGTMQGTGNTTVQGRIKKSDFSDYIVGYVGSVILLVFGIVAEVYSLVTYSNDTSQWLGYSYNGIMTNHEKLVIFAMVIGLFALICGIGWLYSTAKRQKENNK